MQARLCKLAICFAFLCLSVATAAAEDGKYEAELLKWKTYEDVANWLNTNFVFDKGRQAQVHTQLRASGPSNILTRNPAVFFEKRDGYCRDAAAFAKDALNRINPDYQARYIFIKNRLGPPHHWVTGFNVNGKLYVLDYGTSERWAAMKGLHGPYETLNNYMEFLASLGISDFSAESVSWRDIPGQQD